MIRSDFTNLLSALQKIESTINESKGPAYAGSDDALANFKRVGDRLKINPQVVCMIYWLKHIDSIISYVNGNKSDPEPIESRIADARLYPALLLGLINDEKAANELARSLER